MSPGVRRALADFASRGNQPDELAAIPALLRHWRRNVDIGFGVSRFSIGRELSNRRKVHGASDLRRAGLGRADIYRPLREAEEGTKGLDRVLDNKRETPRKKFRAALLIGCEKAKAQQEVEPR